MDLAALSPKSLSLTLSQERLFPSRKTRFYHYHSHSSNIHSSRLKICAYIDKPALGFISGLANKAQNTLPVVGLISRLLNPEGVVSIDWLRYGEFCRVVEKNISKEIAQKMELLESQYGKMARPQIFLFWCWIAAVGAGLVKSDDILNAAKRLRISMDLEFELNNFNQIMEEAFQKRAKMKNPPSIPMDLRVEKALESISLCCFGSEYIDPNDAESLSSILHSIFPSLEKDVLNDLIQSRFDTTDDQ